MDLHADADHHRSVFTLIGSPAAVSGAARALATAALALLDIRTHDGLHPRLGVVDVVPFVPLTVHPAPLPTSPSQAAIDARDAFAHWIGDELGVPAFLYGPLAQGAERTLPEIRRGAFRDLAPDAGPAAPHPTAGVTAVGARGPLVAYNLWVDGGSAELARSVAASLRGPGVRALAFELGSGRQVSCNLVSPQQVRPDMLYDRARPLLEAGGASVARCELVGLLPAVVLDAIPERRWAELGLDQDATVESRLGVGTAGD